MSEKAPLLRGDPFVHEWGEMVTATEREDEPRGVHAEPSFGIQRCATVRFQDPPSDNTTKGRTTISSAAPRGVASTERKGTTESTETAPGSWGEVGSKSLVLCLVLDNPFDPALIRKEEIIDEDTFPGLSAEVLDKMRKGRGTSKLNTLLTNPIEPTFLADEDFLMLPSDGEPAPNKFQKVIEVVLRMKKKGLNIFPDGMVVECDESLKGTTPNYFHGYQLQESVLLTSPNKGEMYINIHASTAVLLKFAEVMSLPLLTHNYSFGGGAAIPYTKDVHERLDESVNLYHRAYGLTEAQGYYPGESNGLCFDPQHKMRVLIRLIREQWRFGGCGIHINELRRQKVLVRNLFPLHNHVYLEEKGLHEWASLQAIINRNPLRMNQHNIISYFGEEVGLYFIWVKEFCLVLIPLGIAGLICGIGGLMGQASSVFNGVFAFCCVSWACYWNVHWSRIEAEYVLENCQEEQQEQEPLRDQFECHEVLPVEYKDIYELSFNVPLSLQIQSDGSMVDLYFPNLRRLLIRFLIGYPVVLLLTGAMITALTALTWWRFEHASNWMISYGSSVLAVVTSVVFGEAFEKIVEWLNSLENNRTDTEENHEHIRKSFLFYFFSNYFALIILGIYPISGPQSDRLDQLRTQMIIICIAKPMFQNLQELLLPYFNAQLRTRVDAKGGIFWGVLSFFYESYSEVLREGSYDPKEPGTALWLEAQMEPCAGTSADYLEITLQFGYMAMFGCTFPFAAPAAVLYNLLEIRIDAMKYMYQTQRPIASPAASIGPWARIFGLLTMCAVATNSYLMIMLSPILEKFQVPNPDSRERQLEILLFVHYVFIILIVLLTATIGSTSDTFLRLRSKRKLLSNKSTREKAATHFKDLVEHTVPVELSRTLSRKRSMRMRGH